MFAKESLYINAIKYKAQLKINYKKLSNDDIVETNSSTFIAKDEILGRDIATNINNNAAQIDKTYISTLLLQDETRLLKKNQASPKDTTVVPLNEEYNVAVSKNTLFETKNYFEKCGVDYIYSAYHVLNLHIEQNPCNNNLVILLFNNQAFCVILNTKGEIVFNKRIPLTPFEEVQDSSFYENEVLGQKLYDEVYALELHEAIQETIEEFYSITKNVFIEKVSLLYNLKLVSEEVIQNMSDEFMIEVTYHPISVDEELFELAKDKHIHKSFIKPRSKPNNSFKNIVFTLITIAIILAIAYTLMPIAELMNNQTQEQRVEVKQPVVEKKIELPNHVEKNEIIETRVLKHFEIVPYDVVLKELVVEKNSSKMDVNLLNKDTFIKVIQPELSKSYNLSQITFKESDSHILDALIEAEGLKNKKIVKFRDYKDTYIENEFMPIIRVTEQVKMLFPKGTIVNFKSSFKSEVVTFNYLINAVVEKPLEFFDMVSALNNELYSINISYPLSFVKTDAGIEIEFILQFHQPK